MNILVLGKNGQLGQTFQQLAKQKKNWLWIFADKNLLDLTHPKFKDKLSSLEFNVLINCAAYTAVDKAETEIDTAYQINTVSVSQMAEVCKEKNALLLHFSTDYVYHNDLAVPLKEEFPTYPKGIYAKSKLEGENQIIASGCNFLIFRTSWVISPYGNNFVKTMLRLAATNHILKIVSDQIGAPTFAEDLVSAVINILRIYLDTPAKFNQFGIYNYSNSGEVGWNELAVEIFKLSNISVEVTPIFSAEYNAPASRPLYSVLDTAKIRNTFGIAIPHWKDALQRCLKQLS